MVTGEFGLDLSCCEKSSCFPQLALLVYTSLGDTPSAWMRFWSLRGILCASGIRCSLHFYLPGWFIYLYEAEVKGSYTSPEGLPFSESLQRSLKSRKFLEPKKTQVIVELRSQFLWFDRQLNFFVVCTYLNFLGDKFALVAENFFVGWRYYSVNDTFLNWYLFSLVCK